MMAAAWVAVTVASYPCYIVVSLADWGSRLWDRRRQHMVLDSCWAGVGIRKGTERRSRVEWMEQAAVDMEWRFFNVGNSSLKLDT